MASLHPAGEPIAKKPRNHLTSLPSYQHLGDLEPLHISPFLHREVRCTKRLCSVLSPGFRLLEHKLRVAGSRRPRGATNRTQENGPQRAAGFRSVCHRSYQDAAPQVHIAASKNRHALAFPLDIGTPNQSCSLGARHPCNPLRRPP